MLRFNNSATREAYESSIYYGSVVNKTYESVKKVIGLTTDRSDPPNNTLSSILSHSSSSSNTTTNVDIDSMQPGQLHYDNETRRLDLFLNGK